MRQSVSTIKSPEFINLQPLDVSPLMSKCEIKVFYIGQNRNGSYIDKETATEMAKTLRGTPIVAAWVEDKQDFGDHGEVITIEDGEVHFSCKTKPYGFVAPDAQVWFKTFTDIDDFGNETEREYLMTNGYLWTGQYEEAKLAIEEGRHHSMELDGESLDGHWAYDDKTGMDFFIINDATFSKLCILGKDVEPCYQESSVTAPEVSKDFSLNDNDFSKTLFSMMNELKYALENEGGLNKMPQEEEILEETVEEEVVEQEEEKVEDQFELAEEEETTEEETVEEEQEEAAEVEEEHEEDGVAEEDTLEYQFAQLNTKYAELEAAMSALEESKAALENELKELREFKLLADEAAKDNLINNSKYCIIEDEDKADIVANKSQYSLSDIENMLNKVLVDKYFDTLGNSNSETPEPQINFSLDGDVDDCVPQFIKALRAAKESNNL